MIKGQLTEQTLFKQRVTKQSRLTMTFGLRLMDRGAALTGLYIFREISHSSTKKMFPGREMHRTDRNHINLKPKAAAVVRAFEE